MENWLRMAGYSVEEAYFERLNQELLERLREKQEPDPAKDRREEAEPPAEENWQDTG